MKKLSRKEKVTGIIMGICIVLITGCGECVGTGFILAGICIVAGWVGGWLEEPQKVEKWREKLQ